MPTINPTVRLATEEKIYELMDRLEGKKGGYNSTYYRQTFKAMNDNQFYTFMKNMKEDPDFNLFFEIDSMGKDGVPNMNRLIATAAYYKIPLVEYVMFPHKNPANPGSPVITKTRVPKLIIPVRRLQQMLDKKNSASANTEHVNPITGQVTGESKAASISDTQTCSLATTGLTSCIKELLGPRADDQNAKMAMLEQIENYGISDLASLNMRTKDKQAVNTMNIFFLGAGLATNIMDIEKDRHRALNPII